MKAKKRHPARALKKPLSPSRDTLLKRMPRRSSLFWDVDPKTVDPKKHARYVIERIMDYGRDDEARWMVAYYPAETIRRVVREKRSILHPKTRAFWGLLFSS